MQWCLHRILMQFWQFVTQVNTRLALIIISSIFKGRRLFWISLRIVRNMGIFILPPISSLILLVFLFSIQRHTMIFFFCKMTLHFKITQAIISFFSLLIFYLSLCKFLSIKLSYWTTELLILSFSTQTVDLRFSLSTLNYRNILSRSPLFGYAIRTC